MNTQTIRHPTWILPSKKKKKTAFLDVFLDSGNPC